ncbi:GntR family transcriptional regulator [Clostridium swellfunianum]|uniref:GntR family transcriptional regulator n=1 Tax=Clostridium swellfunianum TaxID=1367462 RepID=UPI00202ED725|nr:GntR family transcriptional regulator [Clostridium swellfunianum]MCM0649355.1 GntR family transcriptional regulator [Clostridium swellfunianum]
MENSNLLYKQIKRNIIEEIKSMSPNERIASRTDMVKKYNVTRTTIDRAISELIGEGYLYSLNGSGTFVSEREVKAIQQLDEGQAISLGIILPNIMNDAYPGILRGIGDVASVNDVNVIICNSDNDADKQAKQISKLIESGVKGLIIVPAISEKKDINSFRLLKERKIPFVFCNRGVDDIEAPKVMSNNFYGGYIATKHLLENGYRNIAYVSRFMYSASVERYQGYVSALYEAGAELNEELVVFEETSGEEKHGYNSTKMLLSKDKGKRPDAIFCFNDDIAMGAYEAITEAGLAIGEDVGIVGYDNTSICEMLPAKLTSVRFKTYETGTKAAELLISKMNGEMIPNNKIVVLQPELKMRESSFKI